MSKGRGLGCGTRGGFVLIGGFLVHLSLGSFFTFGIELYMIKEN